MLSRSNYDQEYVDDSRSQVAAQVAAFTALASAYFAEIENRFVEP